MSFEPGQIIGDYRISGLLGAGGMGSVYQVRNLITDREEALKILLPDLNAQADLAERFSREIRIHASLDHANIAQLRTALRVNNQLLMIMELIPGETVEQRIARGPVDLPAATQISTQVLAALGYAHARGIIHRDVKPANIMVTPAGVVKVMDFGIAAGAPVRRLTKTGLAVGSLYYMSPEQIRAMPVDGRSDLYSLGVTLYEMLTGRRPFEGASDFELMKAHLEQQPPPVSAWNSQIPVLMAAAISRAIAKRPEDRFQSASEFAAALEGFRTAQPAGQAAYSDQPPATPAASRTVTSGYTDPAGWDPMALERVRRELAAYVGPVARVLVSRAAKKSQGLRQLYEVLAEEIASLDDRRKFLAGRPLL